MNLLDKQFTTYLKGIAIILMVNQHAFGFPDWYVNTTSYPALFPYVKYIARFGAFALVPIFLFLTGYTYYYHLDKSFKYSLRKIISFLVYYWIVYATLLFLACTFCDYKFNVCDTFKEMFSASNDIMIFNWYVFCYIEVMLFLPVLHKIITIYSKRKAIIISGAIFFIIEGIGLGLYFAGLKGTFLYKITGSYFIRYVSMATIGYLVAKTNLFPRLFLYIKSMSSRHIHKYIYMLLGLCILTYQLKTKTTYILTPVYVLLMYALQINFNSHFNRIILFLGKHSMNIWFIQCIFWASATRNVFQKYAYLLENPILVVIWVLFICTTASVIITPIQKLISDKAANMFTVL